jgi:hypothetical protein
VFDPIHINVPGMLHLQATIHRPTEAEIDTHGILTFALSKSVRQALGFLPFGMGKQLGDNLVQRKLDGNCYSFSVGGFTRVETTVSNAGLMELSASFHSPFAQPVAHGEVERVFGQFSREMTRQGIQPAPHSPIDNFIRDFKRSNRGYLDFRALFMRKRLAIAGVPPHPIDDFEIQSVQMQQDTQGDLNVHFRAKGRLSGV